MINRLQKKYALSVQGAKDLFKAIVYSVLANISLMLPVALLAIVQKFLNKWTIFLFCSILFSSNQKEH